MSKKTNFVSIVKEVITGVIEFIGFLLSTYRSIQVPSNHFYVLHSLFSLLSQTLL